jgi:hypothetical protein
VAQEKEEFEHGDTAEYALRTRNELSIAVQLGLHLKERLSLRHFASIVAFLSEREIDELQTATERPFPEEGPDRQGLWSRLFGG